jgi:hypothetical protein
MSYGWKIVTLLIGRPEAGLVSIAGGERASRTTQMDSPDAGTCCLDLMSPAGSLADFMPSLATGPLCPLKDGVIGR